MVTTRKIHHTSLSRLAFSSYNMSDTLEEQVRALTELVKQLQADNQQLRGQAGPSNISDSDQDLPNNPTRPTPVERLVCVPRERKCSRFSGKMSVDNMSVEDWIEEAKRSLAVRSMSKLEQALFLYDVLDGEAKREIKFSPAADRNDPQRIFTILKNNVAPNLLMLCTASFITAGSLKVNL